MLAIEVVVLDNSKGIARCNSIRYKMAFHVQYHCESCVRVKSPNAIL